jgi:hypothetical protein
MEADRSKRLTPQNWLEPDPTFPQLQVQWLDRILKSRLDERVPLDVRRVFEAAQAVMAYGYFYYPLYSVGTEHLYRALEAAATARAKSMGFDEDKAGLKRKLDWLNENGAIPDEKRIALDPLVRLRNQASHPEFQAVAPPVGPYQ